MSQPPRLDASAAAGAIARGGHEPRIGLIFGSGLGRLAEQIESPAVTPFDAVPGMPTATAPGHSGTFVVGRLAGRPVAAMRGRIHMYEGHPASLVGYPVRLLHALGCQVLVATNAAGGINPSFQVGDLMAITDHIFLPGLAGANPLAGSTEERFVSMASAYDAALIEAAQRAAGDAGFELRRGVYCMVGGPMFETGAELRFLRAVGVDAVGMSTAPEVTVARQLGMRVLGISCITNQANPDAPPPIDPQEVIAAGRAAEGRFAALLAGIVAGL